MSIDETMLIQPGGNTRCLFSYSTPYVFQVIPGDSDKLMFSFQGGGACWDKISTELGLCTTDIEVQSLIGIYDRSSNVDGNVDGNSNSAGSDSNGNNISTKDVDNADSIENSMKTNNFINPFRKYTVVNVLYCSGDIHGGNVTRLYRDKDGRRVVQSGVANVKAAMDWTLQQVKKGYLDEYLSDFIVIGQSAGSVGAQIWGETLLSTFKWKSAAVIADSYAGVFPKGGEGPMIKSFGWCSSGTLNEKLQNKCDNEELLLSDMTLNLMNTYPNIPIAFIQSKTDEVQRSFYFAIAITGSYNDTIATGPVGFYERVNEIFSTYNNNNVNNNIEKHNYHNNNNINAQNSSNFIVYFIDGDHHTYTDKTTYYTTDPFNPTDNNIHSQSILLHSWTELLPLSDDNNVNNINSICDGNLRDYDNDNTHSSDSKADKKYLDDRDVIDNHTYCDSRLFPKSFKMN